jgi:hypothetical protein
VLNTEGVQYNGDIALARIDGQAGLDIIAADQVTKKVYIMDYNGDLLPGWPQDAENDFWAAPCVGDLDGDGSWEIIAVDSKGVIHAWYSDGNEYRDGDNDPQTTGVFYRLPNTSFHFSGPALCDLDSDGRDEIIIGSRTNNVYALNDDGTDVPGWPFAAAGELGGSIVAGDIDGDNLPEIVARAKTSQVYLLNHDGTSAGLGWPRFVPTNNPYFTPSPALADFDDDGTLEIVLAHHGSGSRIYVINHDGTDYPGWPVTYSVTDFTECRPTVVDINGDCSLDIILGDEIRLLHAFDISGNMIDGFPITMGEAIRATPFFTDVDLDGDVDMVVHNWDQNVYLFDLPGVYDPDKAHWPTIQGNTHRNGHFDFEIPTSAPQTPITSAELLQNYPNPFNPTTRIVFTVPQSTSQHVTLVIYDVRGARVRTLVNDDRPPGRHAELWNGRDDRGNPVGSGVYFYRLEQNGFTATRKMVLLK